MPTPGLRYLDFAESLAARLAAPSGPLPFGEVVLYWLGQAGFVLEFGDQRVLIDPYLSDLLARKYRGTRYGHVRMMASPIAPEEVTRLDLVVCTHRHTDHMDPDTLQPLAASFPGLRFVVPRASLAEAGKRCGVGPERLIGVNAGDDVQPLPGLRIRPLASAHEAVQVDVDGQHEWLGYVIDAGGVRLYHSGDCIPYPGLVDAIRAMAPQLALLPVNGRDAERRGNGIPGNFSLDEAVSICHEAGVPAMVAHHYGLFDFNTVPPGVIDARAASEASVGLALLRARLGAELRVTDAPAKPMR